MCAEKKAIYTFNVPGLDIDVPGLAYDMQGLMSDVPGLRPGQTRPNFSRKITVVEKVGVDRYWVTACLENMENVGEFDDCQGNVGLTKSRGNVREKIIGSTFGC